MATVKAKGIDISKHQGNVNWALLAQDFKAHKIEFIILRAGYGGGTIDPKFEEYYANAKKYGIPMGAYWYAYWGNYSPKTECTSFLKAVKNKVFKYGIWYDVEYEPAITRLSKTDRTTKTLEGLNVLKASGRYCGLYASMDMINNRMEYNRLAAFDIWCAQYASHCTCKPAYGMWQYTSSGSVSGINGRVDMDYAYKDYPSIVTGALAGEVVTNPEPSVEDEVETPSVADTYKVTVKNLNQFNSVASLCGDLQLGYTGEIFMNCSPSFGPETVKEECMRLELATESTFTIKTMSKGDLGPMVKMVYANNSNNTVEITVGPITGGDANALEKLCKSMNLGFSKLS